MSSHNKRLAGWKFFSGIPAARGAMHGLVRCVALKRPVRRLVEELVGSDPPARREPGYYASVFHVFLKEQFDECCHLAALRRSCVDGFDHREEHQRRAFTPLPRYSVSKRHFMFGVPTAWAKSGRLSHLRCVCLRWNLQSLQTTSQVKAQEKRLRAVRATAASKFLPQPWQSGRPCNRYRQSRPRLKTEVARQMREDANVFVVDQRKDQTVA